MNGYFQLLIGEKGVSIRLSPPIGAGEKPGMAEIREYLDRLGVSYDAVAINSALNSLGDEEITIFLNGNRMQPVDERFIIIVTPDKMTAVLRLYPASAGGKPIELQQITDELAQRKIIYGIDEAAIEQFIANKQYCTNVIVARGQRQTAGKDAVITYHFDTNNNSRPEINENGSVDFFKLNMLHQCSQGQVLAEIIPEEKGLDGIDVFGAVTPAREVKKATFAHGRNLEISEDGMQLISKVNGNVSLVDDTVFVSDVYSVDDVGTATGNIEYNSDVEVKGNVCENFCIKTDGNVFVQGVVEGAVIEAGGDIVIARGMHGQNKGRLKAGGNIIAKFISAATVEAKGFVEAEQILNAKVDAQNVHVEAGKGLITGGKISAKNTVIVKNAGSPMGAATIIEAGGNHELKIRLLELQKSVGEKSKTIVQIKGVIEDTVKKIKSGAKLLPAQIMNVKMLQTTLAETQKQVQEELKEIEKLDVILKGHEDAHIDIHGTMYQGVSVTISGASMNVKKEYTYCRLIKKGADVASTSL